MAVFNGFGQHLNPCVTIFGMDWILVPIFWQNIFRILSWGYFSVHARSNGWLGTASRTVENGVDIRNGMFRRNLHTVSHCWIDYEVGITMACVSFFTCFFRQYSAQCDNSGNLLSRFFGKNFVKAPFLLKKLLNSWFDEIFFQWEGISRFSTLCYVDLQITL